MNSITGFASDLFIRVWQHRAIKQLEKLFQDYGERDIAENNSENHEQ